MGNLLNSRYRPRSEPNISLRKRSDVGVVDEPQAWRLVITQGRDHFCEVTVPQEISEWRACVKHCREKKEVCPDRSIVAFSMPRKDFDQGVTFGGRVFGKVGRAL